MRLEVLVRLLIFIGLPLAGISALTHYIARRIERAHIRRNFFIGCYAASVAIALSGVALLQHSHTVTGWDGFGLGLLALLVKMIGVGSILCVTGVIIAHNIKTANKKQPGGS